MNSKKICVELKFTFEFTPKDWNEHEEHMKVLEEDIHQKLEFDSISTFHHFNNITTPSSSYKISIK